MIFLMMMAVSLSGCIGGLETSEGDDVVLEDTDDWPTYYVPTSGDLPTCDSTILGRLYYVEAETNFQACSSSGWNVIDFSTPLNQAPRITATITADDDGHSFSELGWSAEWMYVGQLTWSAVDPEGEAVTVGVDHDRDGTADIMLPRAEGSIVDVAGGMLTVPWNGSIVSERLELTNSCYLAFTRMIDLISTDASGISASHTVQTGAISSDYIFSNMYSAEDVDWVEMLFENYVTQDDLDWLDGTATDSNCEADSGGQLSVYDFTAQDSGVAVSSASDDVLFSITYQQGSSLSSEFLKITLSVNGNQPVNCYASTGMGECSYELSTTGEMFSVGDSIVVSEDGTDLCNEGHDPCEISITLVNSDTNEVLDSITVEVE